MDNCQYCKGYFGFAKKLKECKVQRLRLDIIWDGKHSYLFKSFCGRPVKVYSVEKGLDLVVSNALTVANSNGIRREKSDSADAYLIAQYLRKNLLIIRVYKPDNEVVVKMKRLQSARQLLLKQKHQIERHVNEMKGFISTKDHASLKKALQDSIAGLAKSIAAIDKELDKIAKEDSQVDNNKELIKSIPVLANKGSVN